MIPDENLHRVSFDEDADCQAVEAVIGPDPIKPEDRTWLRDMGLPDNWSVGRLGNHVVMSFASNKKYRERLCKIALALHGVVRLGRYVPWSAPGYFWDFVKEARWAVHYPVKPSGEAHERRMKAWRDGTDIDLVSDDDAAEGTMSQNGASGDWAKTRTSWQTGTFHEVPPPIVFQAGPILQPERSRPTIQRASRVRTPPRRKHVARFDETALPLAASCPGP